MPPDTSRTEFNDSAETNASLSDQNVAVLYEIVQYAENHEYIDTLPFRAIFAAYDHVLPQWGLDPAHDQVYLRFLFRLGDRSRKDEPLFQSFSRLLGELGIMLEFNDGNDPAQRDIKFDAEKKAALVENTRSPKRLRRNSLNSIYDAEDESSRIIPAKTQLRASSAEVRTSKGSVAISRPSTRATTRPTEKTSAEPAGSHRSAVDFERRGLRADRHDIDLDLELADAQVSTGNQARYEFQPAENHHHVANAEAFDDLTLASNTSAHERLLESPGAGKPFVHLSPEERLYNPTRTQLFRDAETFHHYRIRSVAADVVEKWCDAALKARNRSDHRHRVAVARDTEILLSQAFEHWRSRLHARKQAAEIRRFFAKLERRAEKARSLYLLTKAFTHWAQCAEDESRQRRAARQQILGIKYFHAWRDIIVENQDKVQHQWLKKFFGLWRQRYIQTLTNDVRASFLHEHALVRNGYRCLFWAFCERRAPEWRAQKSKQQIFLEWISKSSSNLRQSRLATSVYIARLRKKTFLQWIMKGRHCITNNSTALRAHERRTAREALKCWTRCRQHAPLVQQISNMLDWRIAGTTFATFVGRFRFEKQAKTLDRLNILRSAWIGWNDCLRWQTLSHRIDDRRLATNLYKWMVAYRFLLLRRLHEQRTKQHYLRIWLSQFTASRARQRRASEIVQRKRNKAVLANAFDSWLVRFSDHRRLESRALEFYSPKLAVECFAVWKSRFDRTQEHESWINDARLFFLGKRYTNVWGKAVQESRRQKRRNAYIQIRRQLKRRIASSCLQQWRNRTRLMTETDQRSVDANEQRLLQRATKCFDHWRHMYELVLDQQFDASEYYESSLLRRLLQLWNDHANHQFELEERAIARAASQAHNTAFAFLRRISLRAIELRGQQGKAERLRLNHERRHSHSLLRRWRELTAARQNRPQPALNLPTRARKSRAAQKSDQLGATRRAEEWTELDTRDWTPAVDAQGSSTPLPGHLSTPSKRAARARSIANSTTPVGTPLQNRLRDQLNSTPRTSRTPFGRSTNLRGNTFGTILEDSPRSPSLENDE